MFCVFSAKASGAGGEQGVVLPPPLQTRSGFQRAGGQETPGSSPAQESAAKEQLCLLRQ